MHQVRSQPVQRTNKQLSKRQKRNKKKNSFWENGKIHFVVAWKQILCYESFAISRARRNITAENRMSTNNDVCVCTFFS